MSWRHAETRCWVRRIARVTAPLLLIALGVQLYGSAYLTWVNTLGSSATPSAAPKFLSWSACACWLLAPVLVYALRPPRKIPAGLCQTCGYDRAGLAEGAACPECGASPR